MNDFLHKFVGSLSAREKAAFRKYASMHSGGEQKNYVRLYDGLESNPDSGLHQIREQFRGESIDKYWSSECNYLFQQLMGSLSNFHRSTSPYRRLNQMVVFVDILLEKGFRNKAGKILRQAKKLAYEFEEFSIILRLIELEEDVLFREGIIGFAEQLNKHGQERQRIVDQIQNLNELRLLREQVRSLQFTESFVTNASRFPNIFDNPLLEDPNLALSIKAKENWYYIRSIREFILRRFDQAHIRQKDYLAFFERHEHFFKKSRKLPILSNSLYIATLNKDLRYFENTLVKLEILEKDPSQDSIYIRYIKYARLLDFYSITKSWDKIRKVLAKTGEYLHDYHQQMGEAQVGYLVELVVRSYILLDQYSQGMEWVRFWYQVPQLEVNASIRRIFTLIIYEELELQQLLGSELDSAYRELKKIDRLGPLETAFIQYCRLCFRHPGQKRKHLQELSRELETISCDPAANKDFVYFDFHAWSCRRVEQLKS